MSRTAQATWLRCYRPKSQPKLRLVCFPHAGGSASFYRSWFDRMPAAVELLVVQYPGREDRIGEARIEAMPRLAAEVGDALVPLMDRPVALFGHSMGASVAYEVAARLENRWRKTPSRLLVSGRPAPHRQRGTTKHLLDDDGLADELRRLGGTNGEVLDHPELRALILPTVRSDYTLIETYQAPRRQPLSCPVTALLGDDDTEANLDEVQAWRDVTVGEFELRTFPGDHFYLVPRQPTVTEFILQRLGVAAPTPASWPPTP